MNDTAHRRGRLAARVRAPRDQQQDKSQESAERSLGACCARAVIAPSPSVWYPKAISFRSHVVLASFITCIILHVHAHRGVACVRTCVHLVHVQTRVCHAVADVYRETRQRVYVSTSSHQTHNSETDDRHTRPQCIALNCNTIRKSVTISVCASASPATSRARPSECAPIITRRRGCQCAFRPAHTPASDHWPLFGRRPEPAQLPLLAALERAHRRLQLGRRAARLGAHGRPRLALAYSRCHLVCVISGHLVRWRGRESGGPRRGDHAGCAFARAASRSNICWLRRWCETTKRVASIAPYVASRIASETCCC